MKSYFGNNKFYARYSFMINFILVLLAILFLSGCGGNSFKGATFPNEYGLYKLDGKQWIKLSQLNNLDSEAELLVFDPRVKSGLFSPTSVAYLRQLYKVTTIIEELHDQKDSEASKYLKENANFEIPAKNTIVLSPEPITKHEDKLVFRIPYDISSGYYNLNIFDEMMRVKITSALPEPDPLIKWYTTLNLPKNGFSYEGLDLMASKGLGEEARYNDRPIIDIKYRNVGYLNTLLQSLKEESNRFDDNTTLKDRVDFITKVEGLSIDIKNNTVNITLAWITDKMKKTIEQGIPEISVALYTEAQVANLITPKMDILYKEAFKIIERKEINDRVQMNRIKYPQKFILEKSYKEFQYSWSYASPRKSLLPLNIGENIFLYKNQSKQIRIFWIGSVLGVSTDKKKSLWDGTMLYEAYVYCYPINGGDYLHFYFLKENDRDEFIKSLVISRLEWGSKNIKDRITQLTVPHIGWSHSISVNGCGYYRLTPSENLIAVDDKRLSSMQKLANQRGPRPYNYSPNNIGVSYNVYQGRTYLKLRSSTEGPVEVTVERFPFPVSGDFELVEKIKNSLKPR